MKIHLTLIVLFLGMIPFSISCSSCGGDDFSYIKDFRINSFDLRTADLQGNLLDTSKFWLADSVTKTLRIKEKTDVAFNNHLHFSFFSTAIACSPPEATSVDKISSIAFISKKRLIGLGEEINVGDTITSRFLVKKMNHPFIPIKEYQDRQEMLFLGDELFFKTNKQPTTSLEIKVDLIVTLSNGVIHRFANESLKIK